MTTTGALPADVVQFIEQFLQEQRTGSITLHFKRGQCEAYQCTDHRKVRATTVHLSTTLDNSSRRC